jgi:ribosomal protein L16/L10AE
MQKKRQLTNLTQNIKFKKLQKGHLQPIERKKTTTNLYYGVYGLKVLQSNRLQSSQLEAAQRQIARHLRKHEFL